MNDIDRAIEFCTTFDPDFPDRIRGATASQIAEIASLTGKPVSDPHRGFLERMGADAAWVRFPSVDTTAEALLIAHRATEGPMPPGFELFAISNDEPYEDLFLVDRGQAEPVVESMNTRLCTSYANLPGDVGSILAGSLADLICRTAVDRFQLNALPQRAGFYVENRPSFLTEFDGAAASLGLTPMWFSTWVASTVTREGLVMVALRTSEDLCTVRAAAVSDNQEFTQICADLARELGLQPVAA